MESRLFTTGEVAQICGVTPDAVLKWIKKGRLKAVQTPGGHYRVTLQACRDAGFVGSEEGGRDPVAMGPVVRSRCWEYFGPDGLPAETCRECFVYRTRAEKCYEVARLGDRVGHQRVFCRSNCEECSYYRASNGLTTVVLIVTRDEKLIRTLPKQVDAAKISLRFARSGYECATLVETSRPSLIVLDESLPEVKDGRLAESMRQDERLRGVKVYVAGAEGSGADGTAITLPITAPRLEDLVDSQMARPVPPGVDGKARSRRSG